MRLLWERRLGTCWLRGGEGNEPRKTKGDPGASASVAASAPAPPWDPRVLGRAV